MARFPLTNVVARRPCGACQACCEVMGVVELDKPQWQRCEHQCEQGCGIYEDRPKTCGGYFCLWALGVLEGDDRRRPDRLGVLFDLRTEGEILTGERQQGDTPVIQVTECRPGALTEPSVEWLTSRLAERAVLALRKWGSAEITFIDRKGALR